MRCRKPCQRWNMKSLTDEVQEALSTMEHEEFDATAEAEQGLKRRDPLRHHPKRQCGLRMCLVIYTFLCQCVQLRLYLAEDIQL